MSIPPNSCSIDASLLAAVAHLLNEKRDPLDPFPSYPDIALERFLEAIVLFDKAFVVGWVSPRHARTLLARRLRDLRFAELWTGGVIDTLPVPAECQEWVVGEINALAQQGLTNLLKQALYGVPGASRKGNPHHQYLFAQFLRTFEDSDWFFHDPEGPPSNRRRWLRAKIKEKVEHLLDNELLPFFPHRGGLRETWKLELIS